MTKLAIRNLESYNWPTSLVLDSYFYPSYLRSFFDYEPLAAFKKSDDAKSYTISFDLPGFKPDEIEALIENNVLSIDAQNKGRSYKESVSLPKSLSAENPSAELKDGVLTVNLTIQEVAQPKKIDIKTGV